TAGFACSSLPYSFSALVTTPSSFLRFFSNHPPPPELSTLSLHDALPISGLRSPRRCPPCRATVAPTRSGSGRASASRRRRTSRRSEEHTSELQSLTNLVCRLLLEKNTRLNSSH